MGSTVSAKRPRRWPLATACMGWACLVGEPRALSQAIFAQICPRPAVGASVPEPEDLRSVAGVLKVDLAIDSDRTQEGAARYCYRTPDGQEAPTLRVHPGDLVVVRLRNGLREDGAAADSQVDEHALHHSSMQGAMP